MQATIRSEVESRAGMVRNVQDLCREKLAIRIESADTDLFATGILDSMSLVQLILELERHFDLELPMSELDIASFRSMDAIADLVAERRFASHRATSATSLIAKGDWHVA